jgi:hypothetical protein
MNPTELKMQPIIHLEGKAGYLLRPDLALSYKCIVGCIFNFVGLIITRESPCSINKYQTQIKTNLLYSNVLVLFSEILLF